MLVFLSTLNDSIMMIIVPTITLLTLAQCVLLVHAERRRFLFTNTTLELSNFNLVTSNPQYDSHGFLLLILVTYSRKVYKVYMSDSEFNLYFPREKSSHYLQVESLWYHYPKLSKLIKSQQSNVLRPNEQGNIARVVTMLTNHDDDDDNHHYLLAYWTAIHPPRFRLRIFSPVNTFNRFGGNPIHDTNGTFEATATNRTVFMSTDQKYTFLAINTDYSLNSEMVIILVFYEKSRNTIIAKDSGSYKFISNSSNGNTTYQVFSKTLASNTTLEESPFLGEDIITGFVRETLLFVITPNHIFWIDNVISKDGGHLNSCDESNKCLVQYKLMSNFINNGMFFSHTPYISLTLGYFSILDAIIWLDIIQNWKWLLLPLTILILPCSLCCCCGCWGFLCCLIPLEFCIRRPTNAPSVDIHVQQPSQMTSSQPSYQPA